MDLSDDRLLAGYLLMVQQWAGSRAPTSKHKGEIAALTYNHRLATIIWRGLRIGPLLSHFTRYC